MSVRFILVLLLSVLGFVSPFSVIAKQAISTPPIAMADFTVNSANPSFTYLGKGFSEIIAFELMKSPGVNLIDREKRNQILKEMEFSMTGLTDPKSEIKMGRLLAVHYLISGAITDMAGTLLVSLSMVDVESGAIVWKDQTTQPGGKYAYIGAFFSKSILKYFQMNADKSTEDTLMASKEKNEASVVALSEGIDALDKGKKEEAIKKLDKAKKIDPNNAVASMFLDRMASGSAKFKVVPERFVPYVNPAYLAGMNKDRLYVNNTFAKVAKGTVSTNNSDALCQLEPTGKYGVIEDQQTTMIGYAIPVSPDFGLSADFSFVRIKDTVISFIPGENNPTLGSENPSYFGLLLSGGFKVNPNMSLGLGINVAYIKRGYFQQSLWMNVPHNPSANLDKIDNLYAIGGIMGLLLKNNTSTFLWDLEAGYNGERTHLYNPFKDNFTANNTPMYVEQTFTFALNQKKTFLALKQINEIYLDRSFYVGRVMPCLEHWFADFLSFRAGVEGSMLSRNGSPSLGLGGTGGLTLRLAGFDIDVNYTYRERAGRILDQTIIPEHVIFVTLSRNGIFKR